MTSMGMHVRPARAEDAGRLLEVWERSVRATHHFLSEPDIAALRPLVAEELASDALDWWVLATEADVVIGFLGLTTGTIEALFIDPDHHGQGGGKTLVAHAQRLVGDAPVAVDVNEQNDAALGFYRALGFSVTGRSPVDAGGRPFPILHMRRASPGVQGAAADELFSGRMPTSHERLSGLPWDASYRDGPAPWDIGGPQPAVVRLASQGRFAGPVLDAGCGTGENALHIASLGLAVLGVDVAETAVAIARRKAEDRGMDVEIAVADALHLERLGRRFATVLDCGLFHTFDGRERPDYAASLASVIEHDGTLFVLCFSDDGPDRGPHPVSQADLRAAFSPNNGWNVLAIDPDRLHSRYHDDGAPAWLATIKRIRV